MVYKYNNKELCFEKISTSKLIIVLSIFIVGGSFLMSSTVYETIIVPEESRTLILKENNSFSEDKLCSFVNSLNMKFPHIVLAQAKIESGHYNSLVFKANNNLFGMKCASLRPTTHKGSNLGHAVYENWKSSVMDYALYQAAYLKNIKTEEEYYLYLGNNYAEDVNYVKKVKQIVAQNKIK